GAHKLKYARGVIGSTWGMLVDGLYRSQSSDGSASGGGGSSGGGPTIVVDGNRLPKPSEGEPIPAPYQGGITTPDASIYTVWTSPTEHHMVFVHPRAAERNASLHRRMDELASNLPDRAGNASLAQRLNQPSRWFPWPALWLAIGI